MTKRRVAVVGAGVMGRLHARAIARREREIGDCELALIVDRHLARSERVVREFGGAASEPGEVDWSSLDAAVVAIPTVGHATETRELLERGLDVLLEKPMALDVRDAKALAAVAGQTACVLQVGHAEWYNPAWRLALERAGRPSHIEVDRLNPKSDRGLDIDVVQDFMLHDLDWVTRIVGEEIVALEARGHATEPKRNAGLDEAEVELRFASGCTARLRASRVHSERRRIVRIRGGEGDVRADLISGRLIPTDASEGAPAAASIPEPGRGVEPLDAQWADFLRACAERKAPANDARVGIAAVALVERVRAAIEISTEGSGDADDPALGR